MTEPSGEAPQPLALLLHDLTTKNTLCALQAYEGVDLAQLNKYLQEQGPLWHPHFGFQPSFFLDRGGEGTASDGCNSDTMRAMLVPHRMPLEGRQPLATRIAELLSDWVVTSKHPERVDLQLETVFCDNDRVRMPDVAVTRPCPPQGWSLTEVKNKTTPVLTYSGRVFAPLVVIEMDTLVGALSQLEMLERKVQTVWCAHGVTLAWLIDPSHRVMYEYRRDPVTKIMMRSLDTSWRDLAAGDVLPGFTLHVLLLEAALLPDTPAGEDIGSRDAKEKATLGDGDGDAGDDATVTECPVPTCSQRFIQLEGFEAHASAHRSERATARAEAAAEPSVAGRAIQ